MSDYEYSYITEALPTSTYRYTHWFYPNGSSQWTRYEHHWKRISNWDSDGASYCPPGYTYHSSVVTGEKSVQRARERTPLDEPPGIGYDAKVRLGKYVCNKDYRHSISMYPGRAYLFPSKQYWNDPHISYSPRVIDQSTPINWDNPVESSLLIAARAAAITNLYGSLRRRQDMALGILLVEFRESLGTIGRGISTIARVMVALRKGRVSDALSALGDHFGGGVKTRKKVLNRDRTNRLRQKNGEKPLSHADYASSMWLELQFGWLPILEDIFNLIEIMNGSLNSEGNGVLAFNGYGEVSSTEVSQLLTNNLEMPEGESAVFSGKCTVRYTCNATYKVSNDLASVLSQLGLVNPLSVAWEVVPFSFVIDWFIPIGNWLDSLQADAGLELIQYTESHKTIVDGKITHYRGWYYEKQYPPPDDWLPGASTFASISSESPYVRSSFIRTVIPAEEIPDMPLPQLSFEELLSPWIAITSLALLKR